MLPNEDVKYSSRMTCIYLLIPPDEYEMLSEHFVHYEDNRMSHDGITFSFAKTESGDGAILASFHDTGKFVEFIKTNKISVNKDTLEKNQEIIQNQINDELSKKKTAEENIQRFEKTLQVIETLKETVND